MNVFEPERLYRATDPELAIIATPGTLAVWRHKGRGPTYIKLGNRVLYRGVTLNAYLEAREVRPGGEEAA